MPAPSRRLRFAHGYGGQAVVSVFCRPHPSIRALRAHSGRAAKKNVRGRRSLGEGGSNHAGIRLTLNGITVSQKRGKDLGDLKSIVKLLLEEISLPPQNRNHKLKGEFKDYWECHIESDWLLIYKKTKTEIIFVRTGTHSDLF